METPKKTTSSTNPETYTITEGTRLYRGDTPFYIANKGRQAGSPIVLTAAPTFFGLAPDDVAQYGIIHAWTATKDIELLHLDNPDVMKDIYDVAPEHVKTVLQENYGYQPGSNTIGHSISIFEKDKVFYEYLCTTGSHGYASTRSEGEENSAYEIMICNPGPDSFRFSGIALPSDVGDKILYIEREIAEYHKRTAPKVEAVGKKKRPETVFLSPPSKFMAFADSPPAKMMAFADSPPAKMMAFADSPNYSPDGQRIYRPLRSPDGKSPIKSSFGTPARKGRALFVHDEPEKRLSTPEKKTSKTLFESPGGSKKRKLNKKRKTKRGKRSSRTK